MIFTGGPAKIIFAGCIYFCRQKNHRPAKIFLANKKKIRRHHPNPSAAPPASPPLLGSRQQRRRRRCFIVAVAVVVVVAAGHEGVELRERRGRGSRTSPLAARHRQSSPPLPRSRWSHCHRRRRSQCHCSWPRRERSGRGAAPSLPPPQLLSLLPPLPSPDPSGGVIGVVVAASRGGRVDLREREGSRTSPPAVPPPTPSSGTTPSLHPRRSYEKK